MMMQKNTDLICRESCLDGEMRENDEQLRLAEMSLHLCREAPMKMFILRPKESSGYYAGRGFLG